MTYSKTDPARDCTLLSKCESAETDHPDLTELTEDAEIMRQYDQDQPYHGE
ncbi:hypothetical protein CCP3SC15_300012 [Gammaproteobacteria bacterium]